MCSGTSKQTGKPCGLGAGHGTDHPGFGNCKFHGGATQNGTKHAAREQAARLGAELDMDPHEALLIAVRKAAMWERYCAEQVAQLEATAVVVEQTKVRRSDTGGYVEKSSRAELNVWVREHQHALDQLARLAKVAIDAGVDERRIRLEEALVGELANAIDGLLSELGVRDHPEAPAAVRRCFTLIEGGRAAA